MIPRHRSLGRARRAIAGAAKVLGLSGVFVTAIAGGALLHLDLHAPRELVRAQVNGILDGPFRGRIKVNKLASVELGFATRLEGVDGEVLDEDGRTLVDARGISATVNVLGLVRSLFGGDRIDVDVERIHVNMAEVVLEQQADGNLGIARAFEPREVSESEEPGAEVSVDLARV